MPKTVLNTAVLGTGLLGLDLVERIHNSPHLHCGLVVGRAPSSRGLADAAALGCATTSGGVAALLDSSQTFDVVFDATNAFDHPAHSERLRGTGATLIDLTPTATGALIVPSVNGGQAADHDHIGLISCGGQASIPILSAIARCHPLRYVEMVATAASAGVGRASRLNLDEYLTATQAGIREFTGADAAKAILNISAADPAPPFRVAMIAIAPGAEERQIRALVSSVEAAVRSRVPGYRVVACTVVEDTVRVVVEVTATRGRIPVHAGNLEVISAAAVYTAEQRALRTGTPKKEAVR